MASLLKMAAPGSFAAENVHVPHEEEKMENQTFISMHELNEDAKIVYISESVHDLLGYEPSEVIGKSPFDYFVGKQAEAARKQHGRGVQMDKAAVLTKWNLRAKNGEIIPCECVFTVVYSVVVAATSLLRKETFETRKQEAVEIANQFDPREDMIKHLSSKFISPSNGQNEPRAALFLNRFTRSLCILYSTEAVTDMLGISPEDMAGKSFLECIHEQDVMRATEVIERAKENDSITYLRFRWRDPRGPVRRRRLRETYGSRNGASPPVNGNRSRIGHNDIHDTNCTNGTFQNRNSHTSREHIQDENDSGEETAEEEEDEEEHEGEGLRDAEADEDDDDHFHSRHRPAPMFQDISIECVISCTSDGLVAVLRRSRAPETEQAAWAPWALPPVLPSPSANPEASDFMECIRQIGTFAWNCAAIHNEVRQYAKPNKDYDYAVPDSSDSGYRTASSSHNYGNGAGPSYSANGTASSSNGESSSNGSGPAKGSEGANKRKRT